MWQLRYCYATGSTGITISSSYYLARLLPPTSSIYFISTSWSVYVSAERVSAERLPSSLSSYYYVNTFLMYSSTISIVRSRLSIWLSKSSAIELRRDRLDDLVSLAAIQLSLSASGFYSADFSYMHLISKKRAKQQNTASLSKHRYNLSSQVFIILLYGHTTP